MQSDSVSHSTDRPAWVAAHPTSHPRVAIEKLSRRALTGFQRCWGGALMFFAFIGWLVPFEALPPTCGMARATGLPCPFCGATRTYRLLVMGEWWVALQYSPLFTVGYLAALLYVLYLAASLATGYGIVVRLSRFQRYGLIGMIFGLLFLNWAYRIWMTLAHGFPQLPWN